MSNKICDFDEISELFLFIIFFAFQDKGMKLDNQSFDICCENTHVWLDVRYSKISNNLGKTTTQQYFT